LHCRRAGRFDVYPEYEEANEAQVVAVAATIPASSGQMLAERAEALQTRYRFRYPLTALLNKRIANHSVENGELLTDDFSPVNLYEVMPLRSRRR
jgi:hypothetical protein